MSTSEIRIYDALKTTLGEENARAYIEALDDGIKTKFEIMLKDLATKNDLNVFREELIQFKLDVKEEFAKIRVEFHKAIYVVSLTQVITIIGAVLAIIFLRT